MATIYKKTIDPTVQDGLDTSVVLEPSEYYQEPFAFGSSWTEIKLGMFISYTTLSDLNTPLPSSSSIDSGGAAADGFSYFGAIQDAVTKFLPMESGGGSYVGQRLQEVDFISTGVSPNYNRFEDGAGYSTMISTDGSSELGNYTEASFTTRAPRLPFTNAGDLVDFSGYIGINLKVLDAGLSTQRIEIESCLFANDDDWREQAITDITIGNLKGLMNGSDYIAYTTTLDFNDGATATTLPDAFFFYNAFQDARARLHAIAVKKIL